MLMIDDVTYILFYTMRAKVTHIAHIKTDDKYIDQRCGQLPHCGPGKNENNAFANE